MVVARSGQDSKSAMVIHENSFTTTTFLVPPKTCRFEIEIIGVSAWYQVYNLSFEEGYYRFLYRYIFYTGDTPAGTR